MNKIIALLFNQNEIAESDRYWFAEQEKRWDALIKKGWHFFVGDHLPNEYGLNMHQGFHNYALAIRLHKDGRSTREIHTRLIEMCESHSADCENGLCEYREANTTCVQYNPKHPTAGALNYIAVIKHRHRGFKYPFEADPVEVYGCEKKVIYYVSLTHDEYEKMKDKATYNIGITSGDRLGEWIECIGGDRYNEVSKKLKEDGIDFVVNPNW